MGVSKSLVFETLGPVFSQLGLFYGQPGLTLLELTQMTLNLGESWF
jgi:hypothetical protein